MQAEFIWKFFSIFGELEFWIGAAVAALLIYSITPKKQKNYISWFIFGALPAVIITWFIIEILKFLFKIPRPCMGLDFCPTDYSFPSGHASIIFASMVVAIAQSKNKKIRVVLLALATLVSLSRVFLAVHTFIDIITGAIIGSVIGYLVYRSYKGFRS